MEPGYHKCEDRLFSAHVHIPGGPSPQIDGYLDTASGAGHNAERGMAPEKGLHYSQESVSLGNRRGQLKSEALHEGRGSIDTKPQASEHSSVSRFRRWHHVMPGGLLCDERDACGSYNVLHTV